MLDHNFLLTSLSFNGSPSIPLKISYVLNIYVIFPVGEGDTDFIHKFLPERRVVPTLGLYRYLYGIETDGPFFSIFMK